MVWRESEEEKTCPQDSLLIFSDVLDLVCRYVLALERVCERHKI